MAEYRYVMRDEIDLAAVPELRADLRRGIEQVDGDLLIDCADLKFLDSAAVAALLEAYQLLAHDRRRMRILNVGDSPRRTFEVLGVTDLLCDRDSLRPA